MKNIILILILILYSISNVQGHSQITHQYLTIEGYKLLKKYFSAHPEYFIETDNYIGTLGCDQTDCDDDDPFYSGKIAGGAWAEDVDDIVFRYGENAPLLFQFFDWIDFLGKDVYEEIQVSLTHFWTPDYGDYELHNIRLKPMTNDWTSALEFFMENSDWFEHVPTSFYKMKSFLNGFWFYKSDGFCVDLIYELPDIITLYDTGEYIEYERIGKVLCSFWGKSSKVSKSFSEEGRKHNAYNILGRILHLVQDKGVPAHVNVEEHFLMEDYFEPAMEWSINSFLSEWDADRVYNERGNYINPFSENNAYEVHGLMTRLAQLTDYMPSRREDGDDNLYHQNSTTNMAEIESIINSYAPETPWTECQYNDFHKSEYDNDKMRQEMDVIIPYTIRVTAGIIFWFMVETGQIPAQAISHCPHYLELENQSLAGNYYLFRASLDIPEDISPPLNAGILNVCPPGCSGSFVLEKCARNVSFIGGERVILNPGFAAKRGCQVHIHSNETVRSRIQVPEEQYPNPIYNRKTETENDCKSNY